jgi:hypothetical protein
MEHAIHVACKNFVEAVAPVLPPKIRGSGEGHDADEDSSDDELTPGDSLGKALALVKQVGPQRSIYCTLQELDNLFRSANPLKPEHSSGHHAHKLILSRLNSCFGFALAGLHFTSSLIAC